MSEERFCRLQEVPGVELASLPRGQRGSAEYHTSFDLAFSGGWSGELRYRGGLLEIGPGQVFCALPGELHTVTRTYQRGDWLALRVDADTFSMLARSHGASATALDWCAPSHIASPRLVERLRELFALLESRHSRRDEAARLSALFEVLTPELVVARMLEPSLSAARGPADRMREMLLTLGEPPIELEQLANTVRLNRFQALRLFKARYGLPPRAYQISVRVSVARRLLSNGQLVADVAAQCGFADQSHFARHFKRIIGVTPGLYAKQVTGNPR